MTYIADSSAGESSYGIKGTATIAGQTSHSGNNSYPYYIHLFGVRSDGLNKQATLRNQKLPLKDVSGDFDAFVYNADYSIPTASNGKQYIIQPNKKVLVIGHFPHNGSHSSSTYMGFRFATHTQYNQSNYCTSNTSDASSSLTSYYAPTWKTYTPLNYTTAETALPPDINSGIGKYFKRAGITKLDPRFAYGFIETPSSGTFCLGLKYVTYGGSPSHSSDYRMHPDRHFVRFIQFE